MVISLLRMAWQQAARKMPVSMNTPHIFFMASSDKLLHFSVHGIGLSRPSMGWLSLFRADAANLATFLGCNNWCGQLTLWVWPYGTDSPWHSAEADIFWLCAETYLPLLETGSSHQVLPANQDFQYLSAWQPFQPHWSHVECAQCASVNFYRPLWFGLRTEGAVHFREHMCMVDMHSWDTNLAHHVPWQWPHVGPPHCVWLCIHQMQLQTDCDSEANTKPEKIFNQQSTCVIENVGHDIPHVFHTPL